MLLSLAGTGSGGVPSDEQLKLRPWFIALLVVQAIFVVVRFFIQDHFGALLMGLVTGVGVLVVLSERGVDPLYCLYYGIMAFVSGFMDVILIFERGSGSRWGLFSAKAPFVHNIATVVFMLSALVQIISACLSYKLYQSAPQEDFEALHLRHNQQDAVAYQAAMLQSQASAVTAVGRGSADEGPKPFQGQAHRL
jgi:hypothetical protein